MLKLIMKVVFNFCIFNLINIKLTVIPGSIKCSNEVLHLLLSSKPQIVIIDVGIKIGEFLVMRLNLAKETHSCLFIDQSNYK